MLIHGFSRRFASLCALLSLFLLLGIAHGGQGPQNVAVVVNARSPFSVAVAHRYAQLRGIPASNLLYLDWEGSPIQTDVETFRQRILLPVAKLLDDRKIAPHITTIAYSSDFPYVIDFQADLTPESKVDPTARKFPQGSLTGMTYLGALVLAKDVNYANLGANFYFRPSLADKLLLPTRAFAPGAVWNPEGDTSDSRGLRYVMSTMLAYTSGRGNSLEEVDHYLQRGWMADGVYPQGKIYYMTNGDVRAKTRQPAFAAAVERLNAMGVAAEAVEGVLPSARPDILGAMLGAVTYQFADSDSQVRPGAICENLTSFGGILRENGGQTALTECLRAGAVGSSGTVTEPFAIQAKFPHPMLHVHYASGCSLAEAYYQSVQGPYQLLIVGDPLCQPWATIPTLRVAGLPAPQAAATGSLSLEVSASTVPGKKIARYELYIDGQLAERADGNSATLTADTTKWPDGSHELRIVGYEDSPIATQAEALAEVVFSNHDWKDATVSVEPARVDWNGNVTVQASVPGAGTLALLHQNRVVGVLHTDRGAWSFPAKKLGPGAGRFQIAASRGQGTNNTYVSAKLPFEVVPPAPLAALPDETAAKPGLKLLRAGRAPAIIERLGEEWTRKAEIKAGDEFHLESVFTVTRDALYQFQVEFSGELQLLVDGQSLDEHRLVKPQMAYFPVPLAKGQHRLEIRATLDDHLRLNAWFGDQGTQAVTQTLFGHVE